MDTLYSCLLDPRVTDTVVTLASRSTTGVSGRLKSLSVTRRVFSAAVSPALRSNSESEPTDAASQIFCAPTVSTSSVTALAIAGFAVRSSALWSTASTRVFCKTTSVEAAFLSSCRVNTTSTRSPGSTKPPTPSTSFTRTVTAFIPSRTSADKVARWPGPVIFSASTGSLGSIGDSTMRLPADRRSVIFAKAPSGMPSCGHGISRSICAFSSTPNCNGCLATTIVLVTAGFFCASRLRMRTSAWLASHDCATKTASSPKTTAKAIMTTVEVRTARSLNCEHFLCCSRRL